MSSISPISRVGKRAEDSDYDNAKDDDSEPDVNSNSIIFANLARKAPRPAIYQPELLELPRLELAKAYQSSSDDKQIRRRRRVIYAVT